MRVFQAIVVLVVLFAAMAYLRASTPQVKRVSPGRFLELTAEIPKSHSMEITEFIGATQTRAYLQQWQIQVLFESDVTLYWTRISGLPEDLAIELRAGTNPWRVHPSQIPEPISGRP
jgi:hypothetical protein